MQRRLHSHGVFGVFSRPELGGSFYAFLMGRPGLSVAGLPFRAVGVAAALVACLWSGSAGHPQAGQKQAPAATARERLVWADEFNQGATEPQPGNWAYETGGGGWGNAELETYCSPRTMAAPCDPAHAPNSFVGREGNLHIVARRNAAGQWTSARLVTHGLQSFSYGRFEARIRIPKGQGVWPAFWALGDDISQQPWPACGELDIMENIGKEPTIVHGTLHGPGYQGLGIGKPFTEPQGNAFADAFHVYGMIWAPEKVQFYVDDPARPYATFTPADVPPGGTWPFRDRKIFLLLNLAIGGNWPGPPRAETPSPVEMLVDYVRVYQTEPVR